LCAVCIVEPKHVEDRFVVCDWRREFYTMGSNPSLTGVSRSISTGSVGDKQVFESPLIEKVLGILACRSGEERDSV